MFVFELLIGFILVKVLFQWMNFKTMIISEFEIINLT